VIKKLDKLIIRAFVGPFAATFFIVLLVLVMQFFWLYIDDFVGKGLSAGVILKFIWYQGAVLVPLALPLAVLLSSLMTFGNLGESFELVAIKASGISLLRFMRPLFIVTLGISGIAFWFSNNVIPIANLKSRTLLTDIVYAKPTLELREGVFYDKIPHFAIKIGKKEANDSIIRDVIIFEQNNALQDNFIIAKSGVMRFSDNKRYLEFNLRDGWRYQERADNQFSRNTEYVRMGFKEYKKEFDVASFQFKESSDSNNRNSERVMTMRQLQRAIDSLQKQNDTMSMQISKNIYLGQKFSGLVDSAWPKRDIAADTGTRLTAKSFTTWMPDSAKGSVGQRASSQVNSLKVTMETFGTTLREKERVLRKHKIEWHRKITLSLACLVLFLIGAPLGSIIRKGGLGTPLIFAIVFFMVFYFSSTTGEKFAKENTMTPFSGMWLATFILVPIGAFLTYKAMHDSQLFNKEAYHRIAKKIRRFFKKDKELKEAVAVRKVADTEGINVTGETKSL
jgi:lipopolysaccharide export system permease protein